MEKLLIEACLELIKEDLVAGMQDLGAAGLTSSIAEAASKKERGVKVDVSRVPRREAGMTPYEVMLSESQERMLIIPRAGKEGRIAEIFDKWGLDATLIGEVTGDGLFKVYDGDVLVGEVPVAALTEGCPVYVREGLEPSYYENAAIPIWRNSWNMIPGKLSSFYWLHLILPANTGCIPSMITR